MVKYCFFTLACATVVATSSHAQSNIAASTDNSKQTRLYSQDPASYVGEDDAYALPWAPIKMSDIAFKKRVWRTIDVSDSRNAAFGHTPGKTFADLVLKAAFDGKIKVYDPSTVAFCTKVLSKDDLITLITPGAHTDKKCFVPDAVTQYCVEEDWLFLKAENKMVVRILSIAPMATVKEPDGTATEQPVFWVYYPDSRDALAAASVTNMAGETTNWDRIFQSRDFASKITKVSAKQYSATTE